MDAALTLIKGNWAEILVAISAGLNLFSAIAALTKTKKDDNLAKWLKVAAKRFLSIH